MTTVFLEFLVFTLVHCFAASPSDFKGVETPLLVDQGAVEFLTTGRPAMLKIQGTGAKPEADLKIIKNEVQGEVSVELKDFGTGIELRDKHMKEKYFQVDQFPKAILKIQSFKLPDDMSTEKEIPFEGELELHGTSKKITGTVKVHETAGKISVDSSFEEKLSSFGIEIPNYLGIKVADKFSVNVQLKAHQGVMH